MILNHSKTIRSVIYVYGGAMCYCLYDCIGAGNMWTNDSSTNYT